MSTATDQIETDLEQSRHRLSDTLDQLGRKLSPGQMLDEALGLVQGQAGQFTAKLGRQVRDNPIPTLLVAGGIAWLLMNRDREPAIDWRSERKYRSVEEARWSTPRLANETDEAHEDRVHAAYGHALGLKRGVDEASHAFKERIGKAVAAAQHAAAGVRDRLSAQGERLAHSAGDARREAGRLYGDNPLAAGAIAVAIGALIGGATPLTDVERNTLGDVADAASRAGAGLAEQGARLAERAADAVH